MIHYNIVLVRAVFQKGLNFLVTSVEKCRLSTADGSYDQNAGGCEKENPFSRHDVMMVKTQKSDTGVFHSLNFICAWIISFKRSPTLSSFSK